MNAHDAIAELESRLGCRPGQESTHAQQHERAQWELEQWFALVASQPILADGHMRAHLAYADLARKGGV